MKSILIIFTFFMFSCGTASKVTTPNPVAENNKDVLILSNLIQEHLMRTRKAGGINLNLSDLVLNDTLNRISNNFEKLELKYHGGYFSVHYNFSKIRDKNVELTDKEKEMLIRKKFIAKDLDEQCDGEIQFEYGERFYHIRKVIANSNSTADNK